MRFMMLRPNLAKLLLLGVKRINLPPRRLDAQKRPSGGVWPRGRDRNARGRDGNARGRGLGVRVGAKQAAGCLPSCSQAASNSTIVKYPGFCSEGTECVERERARRC